MNVKCLVPKIMESGYLERTSWFGCGVEAQSPKGGAPNPEPLNLGKIILLENIIESNYKEWTKAKSLHFRAMP